MENNSSIVYIKEKIKDLFITFAERQTDIPFSKESYAALFPHDMIETPLGKVKLGQHQFQKLEKHKNEGRDQLLFAMLLYTQ